MKYILVLVFEKEFIYLKAANGIWYQINKKSQKITQTNAFSEKTNNQPTQ